VKIGPQIIAAPPRQAQLQKDLERIPEPWRDFLDSYGLDVIALEPGQRLSETVATRRWAQSDRSAEVQAAVGGALAQLGEASGAFLDNLHQWLEDSPYRLLVQGTSVDLDILAEQRNIPHDQRAQWKQQLQQVNSPWSQADGAQIQGQFGFLLLPPVQTPGGLIKDQHFQGAFFTRAEDIQASLGVNRGADQQVILYAPYVEPQAEEVGQYRLALHEVGHALDYALEGLPDQTGFGTNHRQTVDALYQQAKKNGSFTSDRADDNAREFFAEAIEAYFTEVSSGPDMRPDNHRKALQERNPEMFAYLKRIFESRPDPAWVSRPPAPVGLPPGFPDPDRDPIYWQG
jgi:hypothetical protein